uniref:G-protein coupled receptors family 1 profile domain-containing protein n=1 Tax=Apteryx owenii TaxID=8824 RepID=A0A8B9PPM6_APTOW
MSSNNKISNGSSLNEFLLLPFADTRELQLLHFALFLGIYLAALLGNGLIITAVACDHHLHTPMYFFLLNLSLFDLGAISTTVPKSMRRTWTQLAPLEMLHSPSKHLPHPQSLEGLEAVIPIWLDVLPTLTSMASAE